MKKADEPGHDRDRIQNLRSYSILDTPPERVFDDLTILASRICETPIALVSLVDSERQWFKSKVGLEASETSRDISFCSHAILQSEVFVVKDAAADSRFADNPLVKYGHTIRFYAGAPLITPEGFAIGTLCVIDREPRELSGEQVECLEVLARQVVRELVVRRVQAEQEQTIHQLQDAKEALSQTEDIVENTNDLVQSVDAEGRLIYVNRAWCAALGYDQDEALHLTMWDVLHPDSVAHCQDILSRIGSGEKIERIEAAFVSKQGRTIAVEGSVNCRFVDGQPVATRGIFQDVTGKQLEQQRRRDAEEQYTRLFENSTEGIVQIGIDGSILKANPAMAQMLGYDSPDDFIQCQNNENYPLYVDPADRKILASNLVRRGKANAYECRLFRKDRSIIWIRGSGRAVRSSIGPLFFEGVVSDITARKKTEEERDRFFTLSLDLMCIADSEGYFRRLNPSWQRALGYTQEELISKPFVEFVHPEDYDRTIAETAKLRQGAKTISFENRYRCKDGSYRWLLWNAAPYETLIYASARDITDIRNFEEQLKLQNIELEDSNRRIEEANRLKSEFLANMSHELRTPLNGIIGFAELMYDGVSVGPVSDEQKEFLGDILTSARHLLQLINDILDLSKVEAGKIEFRPEPVDLSDLVAEVCNITTPIAAQRRIRMETHIDDAVRQIVHDPAKIKQILYNYVSNAVKFTPENGNIRIVISADGGERFRLEVVDSGIGIAANDIPRLFREFQQLDEGASKKYQGTGLGLALTKRIVEAMGGTVGVSSELGAGSVFFAVLPRRMTGLGAAVSDGSSGIGSRNQP